MPQLIVQMGIQYDPAKLAKVLEDKWPQVYGRAIKISALLGGFVATLVQDSVLGNLQRYVAQASCCGAVKDSTGPHAPACACCFLQQQHEPRPGAALAAVQPWPQFCEDWAGAHAAPAKNLLSRQHV